MVVVMAGSELFFKLCTQVIPEQIILMRLVSLHVGVASHCERSESRYEDRHVAMAVKLALRTW